MLLPWYDGASMPLTSPRAATSTHRRCAARSARPPGVSATVAERAIRSDGVRETLIAECVSDEVFGRRLSRTIHRREARYSPHPERFAGLRGSRVSSDCKRGDRDAASRDDPPMAPRQRGEERNGVAMSP